MSSTTVQSTGVNFSLGTKWQVFHIISHLGNSIGANHSLREAAQANQDTVKSHCFLFLRMLHTARFTDIVLSVVATYSLNTTTQIIIHMVLEIVGVFMLENVGIM
jgi:hypothetical protein